MDPIAWAGEANPAAFERAALGELDRAVGFDAAFFAVPGEEPQTVGIDPRALASAIEGGDHDAELLPLKRAALARRGVVVDTAFTTEREVRRLGYHRRFAKPIGGKHSLLAFMTVRGAPIGAVMLGRTGRTFSAGDVERVEALLPALSVARASYHAPWRGPPLPRTGSRWAGLFGRERARVARDDGALVVRDRAGHREMVRTSEAGDVIWTRCALDDPSRSGWFYVELLHLAAARARARRSALFLGAGGGVAIRQFAECYPGIAIDVVDRDASVLALAGEWFGLSSIPRLEAHVADAVTFLRHARDARWDVIVVDAFDGLEPPASLLDRACLRDLARAMRAGGAIAFNTIGALDRGVVRDVERRARDVFRDVRLVPVLDPGEAFDASAVRNVVVLGRK